MAPASSPPGALRVGVLVDLVRGPLAGGHVRIWERLAREAAALGDELDLTVYFSAPHHAPATRRQELAPNVRLIEQRPLFSTERLPFLSHVPAHTDLAPFHPPLARRLAGHQVLHTTDGFFAFARTALRVARRRGIPLCNSVHTNTPLYTRLFTEATIERALGGGRLADLLERRLRLPERAAQQMQRRLEEHQRACAHAFVSRPDHADDLRTRLPSGRVGLLRRGVDHHRFFPRPSDRLALRRRFGLPADRPLVLFVGRLDRAKNVLLLADTVRALADQASPVYLACAGEGSDRKLVAERLGAHGRCLGMLPPAELALTYACADLLAQPSVTEECSNVILEALASGLPVVVPSAGGSGRLFPNREAGLVVDGEGDVRAWTQALGVLTGDPLRLARMSHAARHFAERQIPSWRAVLTDDLLPVWRRLAPGVTDS